MNIANKIRWSIISVVSLALGISLLSTYLIVKADMESELSGKLEALASSRASNINTYLTMLEAYVGQLSKSVVLEELLNTPKSENLRYRQAFELASRRLKRTKEANPYIYELMLLDGGGRVLASSNESSIGQDKSTDAYFLGGQDGTYIKDAYYNESLDSFLLAFSAPILNSKTNRLIGVVVSRVKMDGLYPILTDTLGLGSTEEVYLVNKYGYMISPSRTLKDTFLKQLVDTKSFHDSVYYKGTHPVLTNGKKAVVFNDYLGKPVLGAYSFIPKMQWSLLAEIDAKEAFAPLFLIRSLFIAVFGVLVILVYFLSAAIAKLITNPIRKLYEDIEIIGSGDLDHKVGTCAKDEIGQLSRAFDEMTSNLKMSVTSIHNLNREVSERKKAEEYFKALTLNIPGVVYRCSNDLEWTMEFISDEIFRLSGYPATDFISNKIRSYTSIIHPEDRGLVDDTIQRAIKTFNPFAIEYRIVGSKGQVVWVYEKGCGIYNERHELLSLTGAIFDINERKLTDKLLAESEVKHRLLFTESRDAVMVLSPKKGFLSGNPAAIKMFGCRDENEFIAQSPATFSPQYQPDGALSADKVREVVNVALEKGSNSFEWVHRRLDGTEFITNVLLSRFEIEEQVLLQATVRDITEQKRSEDIIKESREWFATTLSSIGDAVITTDINGKVTFINPVAQGLTGWSKDEALGRHIEDVFVIKKEDTQEKAQNPVLSVLSNGLMAKLANHTELISKSGERRAIDDSAAPIKRQDGNEIAGVVLVFRDVTERNKYEKKLIELSTAVEQSPACVVITDVKGDIQYVNPKFISLTGYSFEEAIGKNPRVLKSGEQPEEFYKNLWGTITSGKEWRGEFHNKKKNGELYWESASISPIRNKDGIITNFLAVKEDITERKRLERLKDDFVSTISHELRTPLTAIKEGINIVSDGSAGEVNKDQKEFLGIAKRNVDRLSRLINEILDFQKFESGRMVFNIAENDIAEVVREVKDSMLVVASGKGLRLLLDIKDDIPKIRFDRDKITQVVTNLVSNAIKFTESGDISIIVKPANNSVQVSIRDSGLGIKPEDLPRLFQKFVQLESLSERKTGGTGLGLAISKDIIEGHRGKIWAESEQGKGSVFNFIIPI